MRLKFEKLSVTKFILMLFGVFALLILSAVAAINDTTGYSIYYIQILFYVLMFVAFYYFGLTKYERKVMRDEGQEKKPLHLAFVPFLVGGFVTFLYVLFLQNFFPALYESYMEAAELMEGIDLLSNPLELILLFVAVVILAPIVEEIVFRGIFFNLLNRKSSTISAMIVSSLIFGLLHAQTMVPTAVIGFVLCFIYHKTGSLILAIAGHMVNNLIAFSLPLLIGDADIMGSGYEVLGLVLVALYIIATLYFISYVLRNRDFFKKDTPMFRIAGYGENSNIESRLNPVAEQYADARTRQINDNDASGIIDITRVLSDGMPVYEGDPEVRISEVHSVEENGYAVRRIEMNTHASTHIDFPSHFVEGGKTQNDMDLSLFYGEVLIMDSFEEMIPKGTTRVIAKEGYLTADRARAFVAGGIRIIGTGKDSVEAEAPYVVHKILLENGIAIMENLNLSNVERGKYTLAAFPLKIDGAEAAPARVVLIDDLRRFNQTDF